MKKQILMALALVVGTAGAASGQSISASASIAKVITNPATRAVAFAAGTPGGTGGSTVGTTHTAAGAPQMGFAEYSYNTASQVAVVAPTSLTHTTNGTGLTVAFTCGVAEATATSLSLGGCATHSLPYVAATGGMQTNRLWIGGSIDQGDIDAAAAGSYSGTLTLTASTL